MGSCLRPESSAAQPVEREDIPLSYASYPRCQAAARCAAALLALLVVPASPARAQRVQFPSAIGQNGSVYTSQAPPATLDGTIAPSAPTWDPYADPATQPPTFSPYGGGNVYAQPGQFEYGGQPCADPSLPASTRLFQGYYVEHTWLAGDDGTDLDINSTDLGATFAFPFLYNAAPILVTPGFTFHFLDGPESVPFPGFPGSADLPPQLYDAYLDTSWRPQITPWLGADLGVRIGVYSDFQEVNSDSVRLLGRGLAIFTFSPRWQAAAGIWYLDRMRVKLLPAGGLIWTPNTDTRFEMLFPNPKLAQRLTTWGNADIWGYVAGEYGGGNWTIERVGGAPDEIDYNDLRLILGVEALRYQAMRGYFEIGYVFDREIIYRSGTPTVEPDDTVMLRFGLSY
ncbi:MAG: hypothetical protein WD278_16085 [Pirellulales bacterium]